MFTSHLDGDKRKQAARGQGGWKRCRLRWLEPENRVPTAFDAAGRAAWQELRDKAPVVADAEALGLDELVFPFLEGRAPDFRVEFDEVALAALLRGVGADFHGDRLPTDVACGGVFDGFDEELVLFAGPGASAASGLGWRARGATGEELELVGGQGKGVNRWNLDASRAASSHHSSKK